MTQPTAVTVTYEPTWSDGFARPIRTVKVIEHTYEDGWLRGKTREGVTIGPIPESWIKSIVAEEETA